MFYFEGTDQIQTETMNMKHLIKLYFKSKSSKMLTFNQSAPRCGTFDDSETESVLKKGS